MIDRLVCADGGNPDPTSTKGKDPKKTKELELAGWPYPQHLAGRAYGVIVHGDGARPAAGGGRAACRPAQRAGPGPAAAAAEVIAPG
jgi:hypothetical protein